MFSNFARLLQVTFSRLALLLLLVVVLTVGDLLPPMHTLQRFQDANPALNNILTGTTIVLTVLGGLLMLLTPFLLRVEDPRLAASTNTAKTGGVSKGKGWSFAGTAIYTGFSDSAPMWRVRQAFRDGEWLREPRWRRFSLMILGAVFVFYGLFGLLFVLFPPGVKFLLLLLALYATARVSYAFFADQPPGLGGKGD